MDEQDYQLIEQLQQGLPLVSRPYARLGEVLGMTEQAVIIRIQQLRQQGIIKRFGVIVNHRLLGYRANAMIVWNVPDEQVATKGRQIGQTGFVTLCYQRPRQGDVWPYNLYCMIHGKSREKVLLQLEELIQHCQLQAFPYQVLFSKRCFKQRGARYKLSQPEAVDAG